MQPLSLGQSGVLTCMTCWMIEATPLIHNHGWCGFNHPITPHQPHHLNSDLSTCIHATWCPSPLLRDVGPITSAAGTLRATAPPLPRGMWAACSFAHHPGQRDQMRTRSMQQRGMTHAVRVQRNEGGYDPTRKGMTQ